MKKKVSAIEAGLGYTVGNYFIKGIGFLAIPLFSRLLSIKEYGLVNIFISYETFLFIIVGCALHTSLKNARYEFGGRATNSIEKSYYHYLCDVYCFISVNAIVLLLGVAFAGKYISGILNLSVDDLFALVIYSYSTAVIYCFNSDASLRYEYKKYLLVSILNAITSICLSYIGIVFIFKKNAYKGRIWGITVPLFLIAVYITTHSFEKSSYNKFVSNIKWGLQYSLPLVPHGISQVILGQFDRIMIQKISGLSKAGLYSFAYNIYLIVSVTFSSLDNVWSVWFFERREKEDFKIIRKVSTVYIGLMSLFVSSIIYIVPELVILFGSSKYRPAVWCAIPITAASYFMFLYTIPCVVEYYHKKTKLIAFGTTLAAFANIVLNYIFIEVYGYIAAAYTTLFTYLIYCIAHFCIAYHIEKKNLFSITTILFTAVFVLLNLGVCITIVSQILLRYTLFVLNLFLFIMIEEKYIHGIRKIIRKRKCE